MQLVIGIIGRMGAGKSTVARLLQRRCRIARLSAGRLVREKLEAMDLTPSRENFHEVSRRLVADGGPRVLARHLSEQLENTPEQVVVMPGLRSVGDVTGLRDQLGDRFVLVHVFAGSPRMRYERSLERGAARDVTGFDHFLRLDQAEEKMFRISEAVEQADLQLSNESTLKALEAELEEKLVGPIVQARGLCAGEKVTNS